jgi:L-arabinokinase
MGGVADYSGALVLEVPTKVETRVVAEPSTHLVVGPVSLARDEVRDLARMDHAAMRKALAELPKWVLYPLGVALTLVRHGVIDAPAAELHITSELPQSVGVSSSAALEVATGRALAGERLSALDLAFLCQEAENHIVGAPCGIMDQIAVALGTPGKVLPIECRPGTPLEPVRLPRDLEVVGWPTGADHDVSGLPYRRARTAAFMGKRIVEDATNRTFDWVSDLPDPPAGRLPETLAGSEFLDRWARTSDPVTAVDPAVVYPVRAATMFGALEHRRGRALLGSLRGAGRGGLRELFSASHLGYEAMGLGHPRADAVVDQALGRATVLGARSSGGGSGGTVVVLCEKGSLDDVEGLIR